MFSCKNTRMRYFNNKLLKGIVHLFCLSAKLFAYLKFYKIICNYMSSIFNITLCLINFKIKLKPKLLEKIF